MITQDPAKIETLLDTTKERLSEILEQADGEGSFHRSTGEARAMLTGASGMAFDLRQSENALFAELGCLKQHIAAIEDLHDRVALLRTEAARVVGALMENTPPE